MAVTLGHGQVLKLREFLGAFIPGVQNSDLFSSQCVSAILQRLGSERQKSAGQESAVADSYVLHLSLEDGSLTARGRGVTDRGCPVEFAVTWAGGLEGEGSVSVDPHGLFYGTEGDLSLSVCPQTGPIAWAERRVSPPGARAIKARVRRLRDGTGEPAPRASDSACTLDVTDDRAFFENLSEFTAHLPPDGTQACVIKGKDKAGVIDIVSSWKLPDGGRGFVRDTSVSGRMPASTGVVTPRPVLQALRTASGLGAVSFLRFEPSGNRMAVGLTGEGWTASLLVSRPQNDTVDESTDAAYHRVRHVLAEAVRLYPTRWCPQRDLGHLAEGLGAAAQFAASEDAGDRWSGVRAETDHESPESNWFFQARNARQSASFRLGTRTAGTGGADSMVLSPALAAAVSRMTEVFVRQYGVRHSSLSVVREDNKDGFSGQVLTVESPGRSRLRVGVVAPIHPVAELAFADATFVADPEGVTVSSDASASLSASGLALSLATLPGVNQGSVKTRLDELAQVAVERGRLVFEAGSPRHAAGASCPVLGTRRLSDPSLIRTGGLWLSVQVASDTLSSFTSLLSKVLKAAEGLSAAETRLELQFTNTSKTPGLFLSLTAPAAGGGRRKIAQVSTLSVVFERAGGKGPPRLPAYHRYSPHWTLAMPACAPLPPEKALSAYAGLQKSFCVGQEEAPDTDLKRSLTGMLYESVEDASGTPVAARLTAGTPYHFLEWSSAGADLGGGVLYVPPGFFEAAAVIRRSKEDAAFALEGDWCYLSSSDAYCVWHRGLTGKAEAAFPSAVIRKVLSADTPCRAGGGGGPAGSVVVRVSPEVLLDRISSIEGEGPYGRLAWIWDRSGRHQLVAETVIVEDADLPPHMLGDVDEWDAEGDHFYVCLSMKLLKGQLKALGEAEKRFGCESADVTVRLRGDGVSLSSPSYRTLILPMLINDREKAYLSAVETLSQA